MGSFQKIISLLFFSSASIFCYSQTAKIDSLQTLLNTQKEKDTLRVELLNKAAYAIRKYNIKKLFKYANEATELSDSIHYKDGYAESIRMIAIGYYERYDYQNTILYLEKSLRLFQDIKNPQGIARVYINLGNAYFYLDDFKTALNYYQQSFSNYKMLNNEERMGYCYYCYGYSYKGLHYYDSLAKYFNKAIDITKEINDYHQLAFYYNNMGNVYDDIGNYNIALDYYLESIRIKENYLLNHGLSASYNNVGSIYAILEKNEQAKEYYKRAIHINIKTGNKHSIINSYLGMAILHSDMGHADSALAYCKKAMGISKSIDFKLGIVKSYRDYGIIYRNQGDYTKAIDNFTLSKNMAKSLLLKENLAENNQLLADLYLITNDIEKAYKYAREAYGLANECGNAEIIKNSAHSLSESAKRLKRYNEAYNYFVDYNTIKDSLYNTEFLGKLQNLEYKLHYEKEKMMMENKIEKKNILIEKEKQRIRLGCGILVLIILIMIIVFADYLKIKKKNRLLFSRTLELTKTEQLKDRKEDELLDNPADEQKQEYTPDKELQKKLEIIMKKQKPYCNCDLTIDMLADMLNTNRTYLSRLINETCKCNFNTWLNRYRVKEARLLLIQGKYNDYSIEGIGKEVGFNSKTTFFRVFKEQTGITPSYFRENAIYASDFTS